MKTWNFLLLKPELTEFQCLRAGLANKAVNADVSKFKMRDQMSRIVLGEYQRRIASQIEHFYWKELASNRRYKQLFIGCSLGSNLVVVPKYSPNRINKVIEVGQQPSYTIFAHGNVMGNINDTVIMLVLTLNCQAEETLRKWKIVLAYAIEFLDLLELFCQGKRTQSS